MKSAYTLADFRRAIQEIRFSQRKGESPGEAFRNLIPRGLCLEQHFLHAYQHGIPARVVLFRALRKESPKKAKTIIQPPVVPVRKKPAPSAKKEPTPPKNRVLPLVGVSEVKQQELPLSKRARREILAAVGLTPETGTSFLEDVEFAVMKANKRKRWKTSNSRVKGCLSGVENAAKKLLEALQAVPDTGRPYFSQGGVSLSELRHMARVIHTAASRATGQAQEELSGKGRSADTNPAILAGEIAAALQSIGVKPSVSRPKWAKNSKATTGAYWRVTEICFGLVGFPSQDLRDALKKGRSYIKITPE